MPALGLGTWQAANDVVYNAVITAIHAGYRHIDAAFYYDNEVGVGKAIRDCGIPREELFVTTKLWNTSRRPEHIMEAFEVSMANLGLDYVDVYMLHWPIAFAHTKEHFSRDKNGKIMQDNVDYIKSYTVLEKLPGKRVRALGVCNFGIKHLDRLMKNTNVVLAVNQIELHPYLPQEELVNYCQKHGIVVTAYPPLGCVNSPLLKDKTTIADKYKVTPIQILISWGLQRNYSIVPKSANPSRIVSNFDTIILKDVDFQAINNITKIRLTKRFIDPIVIWDIDVSDERKTHEIKASFITR
ncbi:NADP-dependent oxidoreductase domain-containing protein [Pilobolus umbonatus]|nr:NADP-dependent oxidoreductase domain-containing protein [Pilobolus umbonatus]